MIEDQNTQNAIFEIAEAIKSLSCMVDTGGNAWIEERLKGLHSQMSQLQYRVSGRLGN